MTTRKRLYFLILLSAIFILLVRYTTQKTHQSRDTSSFLNHHKPRDHTPLPDEPTESHVHKQNNAKPDAAPPENGINKDGVTEPRLPIHKRKYDDPDEEYEETYKMAQLQFKHFKNQMDKGLYGGHRQNVAVDFDEMKDEPGEKKDEMQDGDKGKKDGDLVNENEFDDYAYDDYANAILDMIDGHDLMDKHTREKMIDKMRRLIPRGRSQFRGRPAMTKTTRKLRPAEAHQESNQSLNLLNNDNLVRNCITGDVIGRVPSNLKTRLFSKQVGGTIKVFKESGKSRISSFKDIFQNKTWGNQWEKNGPSVAASGRGATLGWTQEAMAGLHAVITYIKAALGKSHVRVLDAPCGDMAWMSRFLETRDDVIYTGIDIVSDLIESHKKNFKGRGWTFLQLDLVENDIPGQFDLILSRTMLQHLFTADVAKVLKKLSLSGSKYLFTSTFAKQNFNSELDMAENPGRVRELNLEIPPFSLIPPVCIQRDGPPHDFEGWRHFLGLWELPLRQVLKCEHIKHFKMMGTGQGVYSCIEWSPYIDLG